MGKVGFRDDVGVVTCPPISETGWRTQTRRVERYIDLFSEGKGQESWTRDTVLMSEYRHDRSSRA